jgi:Holliday junction resolvasome RuvABC DNA-binding subunit
MLDPIAAGGGSTGSSVLGDVREALYGLGYAPEEVRDALREISPSDDASTLLRDALQLLGAKRA